MNRVRIEHVAPNGGAIWDGDVEDGDPLAQVMSQAIVNSRRDRTKVTVKVNGATVDAEDNRPPLGGDSTYPPGEDPFHHEDGSDR